MKVVFDTNVFISVFIISGGQADLAFRLARQQRFDLCTSVPILAEVAQTLRGKFGQSEEDITEALRMISRAAEIVKPSAALQVLSDVPDNRILECAVEAGIRQIGKISHGFIQRRHTGQIAPGNAYHLARALPAQR